MPAPYLLDTNAYALFFQYPEPIALQRLKEKVRVGNTFAFYLPEIVSVEIHSVLGKYRRGGNPQRFEACERHVLIENESTRCTHTCVFQARPRMRAKVFKDLQKLIKDIEEQRGGIQATVLPIGTVQFASAKTLLIDYSDRYSFDTHDAMVAACALNKLATTGLELTVVTSDGGLKALCAQRSIPTFDPLLSLDVAQLS